MRFCIEGVFYPHPVVTGTSTNTSQLASRKSVTNIRAELLFITSRSSPAKVQSIVMSMSVSVCLSSRHNSKTTRPNFINFCRAGKA